MLLPSRKSLVLTPGERMSLNLCCSSGAQCDDPQAAAREPFGVTLGACLGHSLCTGIAVVGGKLLASSISERTVLLVGGGLFCLFSVLTLLGLGN